MSLDAKKLFDSVYILENWRPQHLASRMPHVQLSETMPGLPMLTAHSQVKVAVEPAEAEQAKGLSKILIMHIKRP